VTPKKADIFIDNFGVAWMPFYIMHVAGEMYEIPAFQ